MGRLMLIKNAEVWQNGTADVRIAGGLIAEIGTLAASEDEEVIDAKGAALLPGLHDHHIHMAATAMARMSVQCGPPDVNDERQLASALAKTGDGWIRGIGYHASVAGMLSTAVLDAMVPDRPLRIQDRSGRMWFFNSAGLEAMFAIVAPSPKLEREGGRYTGRLFDDDAWVRNSGLRGPPSFDRLSADLARYGITGVTDMSVANQPLTVAHFADQHARGALLQRAVIAGRLDLAEAEFGAVLRLGPAKLHLHEWAMPDYDETVAFVRSAHTQGRAVASHCTTEVELVFTLAALKEAGIQKGDRIEHAGIAPDHLIQEIADYGLNVVSQPIFIAERGDHYLADVEPHDHANLYRLASFLRAGVSLSAGSDAPYGSCDPWSSMRAAMSRLTIGGTVIGANEVLTKDQALALYLADPLDLSTMREIKVGAPADICLLDRTWAEARLTAGDVQMTISAGSIIYNRVDQAPT